MAFTLSRGYSPLHRGVDLAAPRGTLIGAVAAGRVVYAADERRDPRAPSYSRGGGNVVHVDIGGARIQQYAHLDAIGVRAGQLVAAGTAVGTVGATGAGIPGQPVTGPHLHFAIWDQSRGMFIDPARLISTSALIAAVSGRGGGASTINFPQGDEGVRRFLERLASIGISTDLAHVFTPAEAMRIATELYQASGGIADDIARTIAGKTVGELADKVRSGDVTNTSDPWAEYIGPAIDGILAGVAELAGRAGAFLVLAIFLVAGAYLVVTSE
jgi:Peptidase family M23